MVHISPTITGIKQSPPAEPHAGGRHTYDMVLPGAPKGSFVTQLSPTPDILLVLLYRQ
jgi:hypothetical protein